MGEHPIYRGWDIVGRARRGLKRSITNIGKSAEAKKVDALAEEVQHKLASRGLDDIAGREALASDVATHILNRFADRKSVV